MNRGRWMASALVLAASHAACAEAPVELRCLKGGPAALADYRQAIGAEERRMSPAQEQADVERLQRGVANQCTQATRALAYVRMLELSGIAHGTDPTREEALETEILALATAGARLDGAWALLGQFRLVRDNRYYDRDAGVKAYETGAAQGDAECLDFLVSAYSEGRDGIEPDAAKAAHWRERRAARAH